MTKVSSNCSMKKGNMKQTKSVNDKAGGDAWAKLEDVTGASESVAMAEEKLEACR